MCTIGSKTSEWRAVLNPAMLDGLLQQARHETHHVPAIFAIALPLTCVSPVFAHFQKKKNTYQLPEPMIATFCLCATIMLLKVRELGVRQARRRSGVNEHPPFMLPKKNSLDAGTLPIGY